MLPTIAIGTITALFSALLTFFITTTVQKNNLIVEIQKAIATHNEIKHQDSMYNYVEHEIKKHEQNCNGDDRINKIERALVYIITQMGGNPKDAGL